MGLWSADLKAAEAAGAGLFWAAEIDFPDGTERIAETTVASESAGPYAPRLISVEPPARSQADRQAALVSNDGSIVYADPDDRFRNRLGKGQAIANVAARVYLGAEGVARASWCVEQAGVLSSWEETRRGQWKLSIRDDDLSLTQVQIPRRFVTLADFPNAPEASRGLAWPILYSVHDSIGDTQKGAVPCIYVDESLYRYLVAWGWVDVLRAYHAGVAMSLTSQYTVSHEIVNGYQVTIIDKVAAPTGDVTADVVGYDTNADGTGDPIVDPTDVLAHLVSNFLLATYKRGAWAATSSVIDTVSFAACRAALAGRAGGASYGSALRIADVVTGIAAINDWASSFQLRPYRTPAGKLGVRIQDPNDSTATVAGWRYPQHQVGEDGFKILSTSQDMVGGASAKFGRSGSTDGVYQLSVADPRAPTGATEEIATPYAPNHFP